jgi:hypothetical protein
MIVKPGKMRTSRQFSGVESYGVVVAAGRMLRLHSDLNLLLSRTL